LEEYNILYSIYYMLSRKIFKKTMIY
jgi:hypothetical protein